MPTGYQNRKIGNHWSNFHRSFPLSLRLFNRRWTTLTGPYQHTKPDGDWSGDKTKSEMRSILLTLFKTHPNIGFRVRVRGTPPTQDQYIMRRFEHSLGPDVLQAGLSQLGVLYVWADEDPKGGGSAGFDCSGFTKWCYAQVGVELPHQSELQRLVTRPCSWSQAKPGDLVFYGEGGGPQGPAAHVGIKFDDARIIDTASAQHPVDVRSYLSVWIGKPPFVCGYIEAVTGAH